MPIEQLVILITTVTTSIIAIINSLKQNGRLKMGNDKFAKHEDRIAKLEDKTRGLKDGRSA